MSLGPVPPARLRRWTQEVASDPGSLAFLPLAREYAALGQGRAAIRLCLRGLTHHPDHVDAHHLLGLLYRDASDLERAFDEWDIALRLDPGHLPSRIELGLLCCARGDRAAARRHLERAVAEGARSPEVTRALARLDAPDRGPGEASHAATPAPDPWRGPIERFVHRVRPHSLLLISSSGRLLGQHGYTRAYDAVAVASLAAGIHASSTALARLLHEERFGQLYQRGRHSQTFLAAFHTPAGEVIVVVVTRDETRLGLLRVAYRSLVREVARLPADRLPKRTVAAETFERELESSRMEVFGEHGGRDGLRPRDAGPRRPPPAFDYEPAPLFP